MSTARRAQAARETPARRFLERGMARAALRHQFERPMVDAQGNRLAAAELGEHTSASRLERLARQSPNGSRIAAVAVGCPGCEGTGPHVWPCGETHG